MRSEDLTFIIIAQNEERNISLAVESCRNLGSVLVVDGGSSDRTADIASSVGARVLTHVFENHARQYNWGLAQASTDWAFIIDADERITQELGDHIRALEPDDDVSAYVVSRRNFFVGHEIKYSGWSPDLNTRLLRIGFARYEDRAVHARVEVDGGKVLPLGPGKLDHHTYDSIRQYINKLNKYTDAEVTSRAAQQRVLDNRSRFRRIYLRLPGKPLLRFVYMYLIKRGFLDGRAGLILAVLSAFYESVVWSKGALPALVPEAKASHAIPRSPKRKVSDIDE